MPDNNFQYNQTEPKQNGAYDCSNAYNTAYNQNPQFNGYNQNYGNYSQQYQNQQYYQPQYQPYPFVSPEQQEYTDFDNKLSNAKTLGIISIVMAFVIPFIGIILGIIGLVNVSDVPINYIPLQEKRKNCKTLNIVGIVLPFVWIAFVFIIMALFFSTALSSLGMWL